MVKIPNSVLISGIPLAILLTPYYIYKICEYHLKRKYAISGQIDKKDP